MVVDELYDHPSVMFGGTGIAQHLLHVVLIGAYGIRAGHPLHKVSFGEHPALGVHPRGHIDPTLRALGTALPLRRQELVLRRHSITVVSAGASFAAPLASVRAEDVSHGLFETGDCMGYLVGIRILQIVEDAFHDGRQEIVYDRRGILEAVEPGCELRSQGFDQCVHPHLAVLAQSIGNRRDDRRIETDPECVAFGFVRSDSGIYLFSFH